MGENKTNAIAIIIDNSETSINGDFYPNRIDAQRTAAFQLSSYTLQSNPQSQIALFSAGSHEFGVRISFTSNPSKISSVLAQITSGGFLKLNLCIKQAIISFHFAEEVEKKNILCFVGSNNDITKETAEELSLKCRKEQIVLGFVVFGGSVPNSNLLEQLAKSTSEKAIFILLDPHDVISDAVLKSDLGPGEENARVGVEYIARFDPGLAEQLKKIAANGHDK